MTPTFLHNARILRNSRLGGSRSRAARPNEGLLAVNRPGPAPVTRPGRCPGFGYRVPIPPVFGRNDARGRLAITELGLMWRAG